MFSELESFLEGISFYLTFPHPIALVLIGILLSLAAIAFLSVYSMKKSILPDLNKGFRLSKDCKKIPFLQKSIKKSGLDKLAYKWADADPDNKRVILYLQEDEYKKRVIATRKTTIRVEGLLALALLASSNIHVLVVLALATWFSSREIWQSFLAEILVNNPWLIMSLKEED